MPTAIQLRDYQAQTINDIRAAMGTHKRILAQQPTGAGKTIIASFMVDSAQHKGKRVYFINHRQELIYQTAQTFGKFDIKCGIIWAKAPKLYQLPVQVCSIDTLKNRLDEVPAPDVVIWDECHHAAAAGWAKVQDYWPDAWHIGLSATPCRLDGKGLDKNFDVLIPGKQVYELIEMGNLSPYAFYAPTAPDTSNLHIRAGEFVKAEAADLMDTNKIHGDIVKHWQKHAPGKRTIVFAVTVAHSKHIAESFRQAGIMAIHLDGETKKTERQLAAKAFAAGDIEVICNVGLFGEGYDLAAQANADVTVDCIIDAAPSNSLSWTLQKWGRALRPKPDGSKALIFDHAGNYTRHGFPDDHRDWQLAGIDKKQARKAAEESQVNTRQCPDCYHIHRPHPVCPECGFKYKINGREIENVDADLDEIDVDAMRGDQRRQQGKARDLESLVATGMKPGRAKHILAARKEKDKLKLTLRNLIKGAEVANLDDHVYTKQEIDKMKPKELGQKIEQISQALFNGSQFDESHFVGDIKGQK